MSDEKQRCILIVDDDEHFRESMRRLLWTASDALPFRLLEAPDGARAVEAVGKDRIDCVLLDQRMPGGDGVDWIPRLLAADPDLPIVMVTGQGDEATAVNAMKQGAMDYLVKGNISAEVLQYAIANAMEKLAMRKALARQHQTLLIAERHRVMIESLGAACHHLGQPMSVVTTCLFIMKRQKWGTKVQELVDKCEKAVEAVNDILTKLQTVSTYRTEPYLPLNEGEAPRLDERILSIRDEAEGEPGQGTEKKGPD